MSGSRPPIFDDGGGLPETDRRPHSTTAGDDEWDDVGPNYLVRRLIVIGVVVAVVIGLGVVVSRLLDGGDGDAGSGVVTTSWDTVVLVDNRNGEVVLTDDQGDERDRIATGVRTPTDVAIAGSAVMVMNDDEIAVVDLGTALATPYDLATDGTILRPVGTAQTLVAHDPTSQRALLIHGPTLEVIDTETFAQVPAARYEMASAQSDSSGRHVLVTDSGNFQSLLFSFDRTEPSFFPGLALAVSADVVVTAQNVGADATINVFDHAGTPVQTARTTAVRAGMVADGAVVVVTVDGTVVRIDIQSGAQEETATIDGGVTVAAGAVALRGDRLVVVHDGGTTIVDDTGAIVADVAGAMPSTTGLDESAPRRSTCIVLQTSAPDGVTVIDLETGEVVEEALGQPTSAISADGCTVLLEDGSLITPDGVIVAALDGDPVELSPDGATVIVDRNDRLVLDDPTDTDEPIDLGRTARTVLFTDL